MLGLANHYYQLLFQLNLQFVLKDISGGNKNGNAKCNIAKRITIFRRYDELEFYYGADLNNEVIDVKGIKDIDLETYHMDFLNIVFYY